MDLHFIQGKVPSFLSSLANACAYQSPRQRSHVTGSFLTHIKRGKKDGKVVRCRTDLYAVPRPAPRSTTEIQGLQHWGVPVVQGRDIQKHLLSQETRKLGRSHGIMYFLTSHMSTRRHVSVVSWSAPTMHMIMHGDMELFSGVFHVRDLGCRLRRPNRKERDRVHWGPGVVNLGVLSLYQYTSRL